MAKTTKTKFKPSHDSYGESEWEIPSKTEKRPADGDNPGNPEMTSLPDGDPRTKKAMISDMAHLFANMSESELADIYEAITEGCDDNDDDDDGNVEKVIIKKGKKDSDYEDDDDDVKLKSEDVDLSEHISALFSGEDVSEEFKAKAGAIFEAAVLDAVNEFAPKKQEIYEAVFNEMADTLDKFLDVTISEWKDHNEIAIENSLQTEVAAKFMTGMRTLFDECYVAMPEGRVDIMEELVAEHAALTEDFESVAQQLFEARDELETYQRAMVVSEMCSDLTDAEAEKLVEMTEDLDFDDIDSFADKVHTLAESYFGQGKQTLVEDVVEDTKDGMAKEPAVLSENITSAFDRFAGKPTQKKTKSK